MKKSLLTTLLMSAALLSGSAWATGNQVNVDFQTAKKELLKIYKDHPTTIYCGYDFNPKTKEVKLGQGFVTPSQKERAHRVEWEHVVPAENFGRSFSEWREGAPVCQEKGKRFKGRHCAEIASRDYALMQSDLYNLFPSVGAVNALRLNYRYDLLPEQKPTFGTCPMKIDAANKRAEPPANARGEIARAMLYMAQAWPNHYRLSDKQGQLVEAWNKANPVTDWECLRAARIEAFQGNANPFVKNVCVAEHKYPKVPAHVYRQKAPKGNKAKYPAYQLL